MAKTNCKPSYVGRVGNGGNQVVEAPLKSTNRTGDKKITGTDLRSGNTGGKKKSKQERNF